jgi:t-SNARE complex subunit (syntaxin)
VLHQELAATQGENPKDEPLNEGHRAAIAAIDTTIEDFTAKTSAIKNKSQRESEIEY